MKLGVKLAATVGLAVTVAGCGNPGEGTVKLDPGVAARLGKHRGTPPSAYGTNSVEPIVTKGLRKQRTPK
jgi:hypothetical protein